MPRAPCIGCTGIPADRALAWGWIRWAYDVCLPQSGEGGSDDAAAVREDYDTALRTIGTAARRDGDDGLGPIIEEHGTCLRPAWQPILTGGTEGGSLTLLGRWGWMTGWEFRREVYDCSLAMLDEGDVVRYESAPVGTWRKAMYLMDAYCWHRLQGL